MPDDITDTGPLIWGRPSVPRMAVVAHVTVVVCVTVIVGMLLLWGGR